MAKILEAQLHEGDPVIVGGFQPMSSMSGYEGKAAIVLELGCSGAPLGQTVKLQLQDGPDEIIGTRVQFCKKTK